jgi:hypothetical protein
MRETFAIRDLPVVPKTFNEVAVHAHRKNANSDHPDST